jgi:GTP cyclohydrolase IA
METNKPSSKLEPVLFKIDLDQIEDIVTELLRAIGENPEREGLRNTPRRVARFWQEFIEYQDVNHATTFESVRVDQMVVVSGMRVWSLCEHHLLPFWCDVSIGYITNEKVLGLSKFARIAKIHAHRLQVQERLVDDIAKNVMSIACTDHVAVLAKGEHMCMTMRGIETPATMISSSIHGSFKQPEVRAEFLALTERK